ncbi:MAG: hypothetical protein QOH29_2029, partial [Actinomycetota bacterium]|nr:hypothetical protein [Actinomycetota bacterium]
HTGLATVSLYGGVAVLNATVLSQLLSTIAS